MNRRNVIFGLGVFGLGVSSFGLNKIYRKEIVEKPDCSNISLRFYKKFIKGEENIDIDPRCIGVRTLVETTTRHKEKPIHDRLVNYIIDNSAHYNKYEPEQTCFYNDTNMETIIENPDILDNKLFTFHIKKKLVNNLPEILLEEKLAKIFSFGDICCSFNTRKFSKGFHERNELLLKSGCRSNSY